MLAAAASALNGCAVLELHALLQLELPDQFADVLPGFGEERLHAAVHRAHMSERFEDVAAHHVGVLRRLRVAGSTESGSTGEHDGYRPVPDLGLRDCGRASDKRQSCANASCAQSLISASSSSPPCQSGLLSAHSSSIGASAIAVSSASADAAAGCPAACRCPFGDFVDHRLAAPCIARCWPMIMSIERCVLSGSRGVACGVIRTLGASQSGESAGSGSLANTSRPAPAIWPVRRASQQCRLVDHGPARHVDDEGGRASSARTARWRTCGRSRRSAAWRA